MAKWTVYFNDEGWWFFDEIGVGSIVNDFVTKFVFLGGCWTFLITMYFNNSPYLENLFNI